MKKYFTLMMSLFMAFAFTACSEDKGGDDGEKTVTSADVAGTYNGSLEVTLGESEPIVSEGTITVSASGDNGIGFSLENFKLQQAGGITLYVGNIALSNVLLDIDGLNASFATEQNVKITAGTEELPAGQMWMGPMLSGENGLAIKVSGNYTDGNLVMSIEIPFNGMNIKVKFDGTKSGNGSVGGDDNEPSEPEVPVAELTADSIAGVYNGTMAVTLVEGTQAIEQEGRVEITAAGEDKLTLSLKNFKLLSDAASGTYMYVGNIELTDVAFTVESGEAVFSVEQGIQITAGDEELPAGHDWIGPKLTATAGPDGIPVNIDGNYSGGAVSMNINIPFTGMNINVEFNGTK
ncbi:MAG TPA: calycin-like domain-containing protein [Candidatus Avibacteroides excrementipullorum]|nr:calycin-like domain-containing protein [Candidatus Avibacteroides excrementipullorum]